MAPIIRSYGYRWRIETFFEDYKQDLGFGVCEVQAFHQSPPLLAAGVAPFSLLRLGPATSASVSIRPRATSFHTEGEWSLKEAIYNLVTYSGAA